jgi:NAD(P)H-flavin reductase
MVMKSLLFAAAVLIGVPDRASAFAPGISSAGLRVSSSAGIGSSAGNILVGASDGLVHGSAFWQQSKGKGTALFMGWGPEPEWSPASILSTEVACPSGSCVSVAVTVSPDLVEEYKIPGQYVQVRRPGSEDNPLFLAIASPPGPEAGNTIEFLIKRTENNAWITDAASGSGVEISQCMGGGFPMAENLEGFKYDFPTQNVLLFATGSGIAPIRSAIESGQLGVGGGRSARLYYGCATPDDMPYAERFGEWEQMGVEVVPVISRPENVAGGWSGRTGYVQNALEEDGVPIPRNSGALLCGVKGMCEAVKDVMTKAGTFEGRVLTNF